MRKTAIVITLLVCLNVYAADRELGLARQMLEDAIIRDHAEGMEIGRGRLMQIAADGGDRTALRDAHTLIALSWNDDATSVANAR